MGLHREVWTPTWREVANCAALVEAREWNDEGAIALVDNLMAFGVTNYAEEEFFCGTYMRNYCSREFWSGARWEGPITTGPLASLEPMFEWYGGGCSNIRQCKAYGTEDNALHAEEPDSYSLFAYRLGATFWDLWHETGEGYYNHHEFKTAEIVNSDDQSALTVRQQMWLTINAATEEENRTFWKERNPKCPISPTWSSEPVELEAIFSMLSQHTLML